MPDCERCGLELKGTAIVDGAPVWWDGDEVTCEDCGTVSRITVNDSECYEDSDIGTAYVQGWTCKHGTDDETPCTECDAEDEAARAPAEGEEKGHE
jgi:hypothetical protein